MPATKKPRIGAHTPTSGGMAKRSIAYAETIGAEAIQVFTSNPRGWAMPETNHEADALFRERADELDLEVYVHAPFLINLGSPTEGTYKNSLASTAYSLKRGQEIGALGVVVHTGSAVNEDFIDSAWKQIHEGMMPILNALSSDAPYLLLEPTAGQGQSLVKRLEDLDFSAYDHTYSVANISASWDNAGGSGYYYPLIDYGSVSTGTYGVAKKDFQYTTFRPALYVKEYIQKIFAGTDYTFDCSFFDTPLFTRLIIKIHWLFY